ncbi:MAG TPA: hypothetical protein EYP55_03805 [Anaerolineae bacterium]|nr:hypothetical protein [Anaerolineae bacterium]
MIPYPLRGIGHQNPLPLPDEVLAHAPGSAPQIEEDLLGVELEEVSEEFCAPRWDEQVIEGSDEGISSFNFSPATKGRPRPDFRG